jgi:hypothetical protein
MEILLVVVGLAILATAALLWGTDTRFDLEDPSLHDPIWDQHRA